jgi:hypothetical protein
MCREDGLRSALPALPLKTLARKKKNFVRVRLIPASGRTKLEAGS